MRLFMQSWTRTLGKLGKRMVHKPRKKLRRKMHFEQCEARMVMSVSPSFNAGLLTFDGDLVSANDSITLAVNGSGNVTWNNSEFLGGIPASDVTSIDIL